MFSVYTLKIKRKKVEPDYLKKSGIERFLFKILKLAVSCQRDWLKLQTLWKFILAVEDIFNRRKAKEQLLLLCFSNLLKNFYLIKLKCP